MVAGGNNKLGPVSAKPMANMNGGGINGGGIGIGGTKMNAKPPIANRT